MWLKEPLVPDVLNRFFRYVEFYLDLVCTPENISLLYHLASKLKTVRDAEGHTYSEVSVHRFRAFKNT